MTTAEKTNYHPDLNTPIYALDKGYSFIPSSDKWVIAVNTTLDVGFIHQSELSKEQKEDLLNILAFRVTCVGDTSAKKSCRAFKRFLMNLKGKMTFESTLASYNTLTSTYLNAFSFSVRDFALAGKKFQEQSLKKLYLDKCKKYQNTQFTRKMFDCNRGAHTPIELESVFEGMRLLTQKMHQMLNIPQAFNRKYGHPHTLISGLALVIMMSVLRRPVQLRQIKMCDFRTKGDSLNEHFSDSDILIDYDELKLQTFRAKCKYLKERENLDEDLHLLNRSNSRLILKYISILFNEHLSALTAKGIELTKTEKKEIFSRFPLFPTYELIIASEINSKEQLFCALQIDNTLNHVSKDSLAKGINDVVDKVLAPLYHSDRVTSPINRITGNNRIRHTILTKGARDGLDGITLSAITGVTPKAVAAYIDITAQERAMIDDIFGKNATLVNFGKIKVQNQLYPSKDIAFDEFGDKYGSFESNSRCMGCREKLPVPLCCYGCDNFTALSTGNHNHQLEKVIQKYDFNKRNGQSEVALMRLEKAIKRIKATIDICTRYNRSMEITLHDQ
ncbi:hypothetical protein Swoo_4012 [Shewanella woodyi ATCC 51908]|uniref:Uncharacterized protein n=2 Tax=Shewanella woodyi TaxID=60961 RepID=B1KGD1_SHEWM|nr:hypothetical protein Swoo_4012 [Shewanella woodyi ATCC 51908]